MSWSVPAAINAVVTIGILALMTSCSLEYGVEDSEAVDASVPNSIVVGYRHTVVESDGSRVTIEAQRAEYYRNTEEQHLTEISFEAFDSDGELLVSGSAARALIELDTNNADLSGGVEMDSRSQGAQVSSETLYWDEESRILSSDRETVVTIVRDNGTRIEGRGFVTDLSLNVMRFEGGASGVIYREGQP